MAQPKARLYQRLRAKGFPWVLVEFHKNGNPKPYADAFQFGVRYSIKGKRKLDTAATLNEALAIFRDRRVRQYAQQNGVVQQEEASKRPECRTVIADAITEYLTTGKAYEKKWSEDTIRCYRDSTSLFLRYCVAEGVEHIQGIDKKVVLRFKPFLRESKDRYGFQISDRTVFNHFLNTVSFLNEYKVDHGLKGSDWPTFPSTTDAGAGSSIRRYDTASAVLMCVPPPELKWYGSSAVLQSQPSAHGTYGLAKSKRSASRSNP
jgi:hypothetical protein